MVPFREPSILAERYSIRQVAALHSLASDRCQQDGVVYEYHGTFEPKDKKDFPDRVLANPEVDMWVKAKDRCLPNPRLNIYRISEGLVGPVSGLRLPRPSVFGFQDFVGRTASRSSVLR